MKNIEPVIISMIIITLVAVSVNIYWNLQCETWEDVPNSMICNHIGNQTHCHPEYKCTKWKD